MIDKWFNTTPTEAAGASNVQTVEEQRPLGARGGFCWFQLRWLSVDDVVVKDISRSGGVDPVCLVFTNGSALTVNHTAARLSLACRCNSVIIRSAETLESIAGISSGADAGRVPSQPTLVLLRQLKPQVHAVVCGCVHLFPSRIGRENQSDSVHSKSERKFNQR